MTVADARAVVRLVDELLWVLRRDGVVVSTSQAIDAVRALRAVGLGSRATMREALAAVIVTSQKERARFDAAFDAFFTGAPRATLWERLAAAGFATSELDVLRELTEALAQASPEGGALVRLTSGGAEVHRLLQLAGAARGVPSRAQAGFHTHKLLDAIGAPRAASELGALEAALTDALPAERARALLAALRAELRRAERDTREHVLTDLARREEEQRVRDASERLTERPLVALEPGEREAVRRAVRAFAMRLRGGERVRRKRARRGRVDPARTRRLARRTDFVPLVLARRARRRDRPELVVLCDVSESVRAVSTFLLELTYALQELFAKTRSFVFVSELAETTALFERETAEGALGRVASGGVVPVTSNSSYGRVLRAFEARHLAGVTRRTTVVVLGDGRTNFQDDGADVLERLRARARAVVWLCPEPRAAWASGDSAMAKYAARCTKVLETRTAEDLEVAARYLATLR